ncbi:hypothetical protein SCLCIDRAFT_668184 [Scleroderma citrinum Foug A]|uniref:Uncharacterized protein n=1 Tax=Scleroderma citrinum Foug A TaxID=1036808 RepID=A0A0C2ZE10_9AGAM|nr:hypothetical protein SCLCIDRAFT_668184 [Scleroderma citrinum Foug A]
MSQKAKQMFRIFCVRSCGLISGLSSGRRPGNAQLAGRPESAPVVLVAQPYSHRTPWSVHTRTSVYHERVLYVPPGFVIFDNCPRFGAICNGLGTFLPSRCRLLPPPPETVRDASLHFVIRLDPNTIWQIIL